MKKDEKYEVYSVKSGRYGDGGVTYTLTRRILQGETVFGIIIEEVICGRTVSARADDISRDREEALEMLDLFYNERLDAVHLTDVLEEILPYASFKGEKEEIEGKQPQFK